MNSTTSSRATRVVWPGLLALALIVVAVLLANGLPRLANLVAARRAPAGVVAAPAQTEIVYVSPALPPTSKPGACSAGSLFSPRADAWRCTVQSAIFDPCFETAAPVAASVVITPGVPQPAATGAIVCGAEPLSGAPGFVVRDALPPADTASTTPAINASTLESIAYRIDLLGAPVTLTRGQFYVPWVESTQGSLLVGLSELRAAGDLDGDGDEDQAVLLVADAADDRMFIYVGAVVNDDGVPRASATLRLGDRVKVDNLEVENGQIVVTLTTHTSDDPACCPTLDAEYHYVLAGDALTQIVDGWRLELAGGVQCQPVEAQAAGGGVGFAYQCSDGSWLNRGLLPGQVWQALAAGSSSAGSVNAEPRWVPVVRVWQ